MPVPAGVVSNAGVLTLAAFFDMATESRRSADLDGPHQPEFLFRK